MFSAITVASDNILENQARLQMCTQRSVQEVVTSQKGGGVVYSNYVHVRVRLPRKEAVV